MLPNCETFSKILKFMILLLLWGTFFKWIIWEYICVCMCEIPLLSFHWFEFAKLNWEFGGNSYQIVGKSIRFVPSTLQTIPPHSVTSFVSSMRTLFSCHIPDRRSFQLTKSDEINGQYKITFWNLTLLGYIVWTGLIKCPCGSTLRFFFYFSTKKTWQQRPKNFCKKF